MSSVLYLYLLPCSICMCRSQAVNTKTRNKNSCWTGRAPQSALPSRRDKVCAVVLQRGDNASPLPSSSLCSEITATVPTITCTASHCLCQIFGDLRACMSQQRLEPCLRLALHAAPWDRCEMEQKRREERRPAGCKLLPLSPRGFFSSLHTQALLHFSFTLRAFSKDAGNRHLPWPSCSFQYTF